jgi:hypothetical protein
LSPKILRRGTSLNAEFWLLLSLAVAGCAQPGRLLDNDPPGGDPDLARPAMSGLKDLGGVDLMSTVVDLLAPASPDLKTTTDMAGGGSSGGFNATDLCTNAPLLPAGTTYVDHDTSGYADNYDFGNGPSTACSPAFNGFGYDGPDGAYRFVIDPGKTLSVQLTENDSPYDWDSALAIVTSCTSAGPTCLAGSDSLTDTESVSYKNTGSSPLTVYILVDGFLSSEYGKYTIRADVN